MAFLSKPSGSTSHEAWNVPYNRNVHFTGRDDELNDLRGSLASNEPARRVQVICGLGGVGKTQLALEYVYRNQDLYKIVWWINADEPATLALGYAKLATHIGMHVPEGTSLDDIRHAVATEAERAQRLAAGVRQRRRRRGHQELSAAGIAPATCWSRAAIRTGNRLPARSRSSR
jgi:hypothetical protein